MSLFAFNTFHCLLLSLIEMSQLKCTISALFYLTFHACSLASVGRFSWTRVSCAQKTITHNQGLALQVRLVKHGEGWKVFCFSSFLQPRGMVAWSGVAHT